MFFQKTDILPIETKKIEDDLQQRTKRTCKQN